jgi:hypothetical protein
MFCSSKRRRRTRADESNLHPTPCSQTEAIHTEDDSPLCSACSALDLRAILQYGIPERHAISLGQLADILDRYDHCGLCQLVATVVRRKWGLDEWSGIDTAGITCSLCTVDRSPHIPDDVSPEPKDIRLCVHTSGRARDEPIALSAVHSHPPPEIHLLEEDASKVGRTRELHGRRVGRSVDIGLLKRWIQICENGHRGRCETVWWRSAEDVLPKSVRVLDVARMAIVPAPPACRFVALSYVWGGPGEQYWTTKANLKQRSRRGGLDASLLPGTISDTIQLTHQLDERYLWIDALCIVQDDPADKAVQIGVMELIYGSSVFTIFASDSTSARDPLPGVRPNSRDPQQQVTKIQGLHLAVPNSLNHAIANSAWNQRGWTYQEVMLSRRRIFLTTHQMCFECNEDMWCEGVVAEPVGYPRTAIPSGGHGGRAFVRVQQDDSQAYLKAYVDIIKEITQRRFTVETDIVDAITALLNALTKGYEVAGGIAKAFQFGIPLVDLEEALLWQPAANATHSRRVPANGISAPWPSWSWAAWRDGAGYSSLRVFTDIQSSQDDFRPGLNQSLVEQWYIVNDDGQPVPQEVRHLPRSGELNQGAKSTTYVASKGYIDTQQLITENLNAPLRPGTLVFRTSSARFDVMKARDVAGADVTTNYAVYSILSDIPRPSTLVGRVILPCFTHSLPSCEFVVLSRTGHCRGLYDQDVLGKPYFGCMLYVMAVQKTKNEARMERLGLGVIFEPAWSISTAEQKIVLLE